MKVFSSFVLLLACELAIINIVVGSSNIFCLTRDDCKRRQKELGLKRFKSGNYDNMGWGYFSKNNNLYWVEGGSYQQITTSDLGSSFKKRVTCGGAAPPTVLTHDYYREKQDHQVSFETREASLNIERAAFLSEHNDDGGQNNSIEDVD